MLHEYWSKLAQHLPVSPRARGKSKAAVCAAGDLLLHERTVRMRVHRVRTDSLRALMRRQTQEKCVAADGTTVQSTENGLDMELGTYEPNFAHISLSVSTYAAHVLGQVKVVWENHQPKLHIDDAIAAS